MPAAEEAGAVGVVCIKVSITKCREGLDVVAAAAEIGS